MTIRQCGIDAGRGALGYNRNQPRSSQYIEETKKGKTFGKCRGFGRGKSKADGCLNTGHGPGGQRV